MNEVTDEPVEMSVEEGRSQPVQGLLGTLRTRIMGLMEQLRPQRLWHCSAPEQQHAINHRPALWHCSAL
jgi:hypothetical protein